jgi:hypothetical protein
MAFGSNFQGRMKIPKKYVLLNCVCRFERIDGLFVLSGASFIIIDVL